MADLNKIIDDLSKLTVVEAAELSKQLEENGSSSSSSSASSRCSSGGAPAEKKTNLQLF